MWLELLTQLGQVGAFVRERRGPAAESKAYCAYVQTLLERTALRLGFDPIPGECMNVILTITRGVIFANKGGEATLCLLFVISIVFIVRIASSDSVLRGLVMGKLAGSGREDALAKAHSLFAAHVANPVKNAIASDLRSTVYSIVLDTEDEGQTLEQLIEV